jgi:thiol-disulfide isomerase/thioredoxin
MKKTTILSVMAVLWLFKPKAKGTKLKAYLLTILIYFSMASLQAQNKLPAFKIGTKLSDSILNASYNIINHPDGITTTTLNAYKGKLLILDFWASWCGTCLAQFPKLDSLQAKYKDRLSILLVGSVNTKDNTDRMLKVLNGKLTETKPTQLSSLVNDSLLMKMFPHQYLSHYVWISARGEVLAITPAEFVSDATISALLPKKP